jgi:hypothetical protein
MKSALFAWILLALAAAPAAGQTHRASIRGVVLDPTGAPVAGAVTKAVQEETNDHRTVTSGEEGRIALAQLPPGRYRVEIEKAGFKRYVQVVTLQVNQALWLEVRLQLGAPAESVDVVAPFVSIRNDSAALGTVIDQQQVAGLPLDGRNFLELSLLAPGTVPAAQGSAGSVRGEFAMNVNGAREDSNAFLLDGVYNLDPKLNSVGVRPPADAIREFEVLTSTHDASFGRNAGGQVNVVTKSGGNKLSATAHEFFRNQSLDARNYFAPRDVAAPDYRRNQFGGSLGGPVARNRTFFMASYEGTRLDEGITRVTSVPTDAERRGDFSQSLLPVPTIPGLGFPFPGGRIPPEFVHPIGAAIAGLYPSPNRAVPFANFVSSPVLHDRNDQADVRVDHVFSDAARLTARYSLGDRRLYEPFSGPGFAAVPGFGTNVPRRGQNLAISGTQVLSPAFLNEARVAYTRVSAGAFHENTGRSLNTAVGLPELSANDHDFGLSFISVTGFSPLGDEYNNPQHGTTNMLQALDTVTWTRGRHLVKAGAEVRLLRQDAYRDVQARGFLNFTGVFTGNPLADLLLGLPTLTGGARLDNPQRLRTETYSAFVHDSYRLGADVTVSAGVRYEFTSPPVDPDDRATLYDPATRSLVQVGTAGMPRSGYESDRNNIAPRLGVAWSPGGRSDTVVRGGYGIYYDQSALAPGEGLYFSAPHFDLNLYFPLPGLPLSIADPFPAFFPVPIPDSALAYQRDLRTGYLEHWNVNVQRQIGRSRALEVAYVGSRGHNLISARDLNQPAPAAAFPQQNPRPDLQFADITLIESRARSRYDSLQLRFQQRFERGLSLLASYTLAKSTDDASGFFSSAGDPNFPQDSRNPQLEHGRSSFDVRQRFSLSFGYELPFRPGTGLVGQLCYGWEFLGIVTLQTGRPFTVALLPEIDNSNTGRSSLGFGANDRPNVSGDPSRDNPAPERWFDTGAFSLPPYGSFGNAGRNILEGPGYANVNLALVKQFHIRPSLQVQLRGEAFNVFNRVNFNLPDNFFGSPTFGQVLSAGAPRRVQIGVKVLY